MLLPSIFILPKQIAGSPGSSVSAIICPTFKSQGPASTEGSSHRAVGPNQTETRSMCSRGRKPTALLQLRHERPKTFLSALENQSAAVLVDGVPRDARPPRDA